MATDQSCLEHDWETVLIGYGLACGFFTKVFYESPTTEFLDSLVSGDLFADWPLDVPNEKTQTGLRLLRAFCEGWSEDCLPALKWDYNRLFVGPGHVLAPPWESVYLSSEHLVFERQTLEVRQVYRCFGLQAPRLNVEPDDHLGLELAFVVHLCSLGLAAIERGDAQELDRILQAQRDFLSIHLLRWAPLCLQQVVEAAQTDYYRGTALLALGSLETMARGLGLEIETAEVAG